MLNPSDTFIPKMIWEFYALYLAQLDQQDNQIGALMVKSVLVRGKEILITPANLFIFWWQDIPVPEVDPMYRKPLMHKHYSWIADVIAVGPQSWESTSCQIYWHDLLETIILFDLARKNLIPSRNAIHVSWGRRPCGSSHYDREGDFCT